ncbi:MAG: 50S ribosomal protein L4 [Thermodesulfobacteriota bacterium]
MPLAEVVDIEGSKVKDTELSEAVFQAPVKEHLFYEVVKMHLANKRAGTASTKTRGEVRGGGAKPWRQKGTGRARAGSRRSPVWKGGGVVFGPRPRDYSYSIPKRARKEALRSALSLKFKTGELKILSGLKLKEIKTKVLVEILNRLDAASCLIVTKEKDPILELSARNIDVAKLVQVEGMRVYDILSHKKLVIEESAIEAIEGVFV